MKRLLILVAVAGLVGCASNPAKNYGRDPSVQLLQNAELPVPGVADLEVTSRPYLIGPYDRLVIDVFGVEGMTDREVQADGSGNISFPIAGVVRAQGLTPAQLQESLAERLRAGHVRDPQVTVSLKEMVSHVVTVDGEVREPGLYPVMANMTLVRAVATAKGLSDMARQNEVVVFRTVDGQRYAALYDLGAIRHGAYPDPAIYPNDVVVVGESPARRLFQIAANGAASLSPLILLLQVATSGSNN